MRSRPTCSFDLARSATFPVSPRQQSLPVCHVSSVFVRFPARYPFLQLQLPPFFKLFYFLFFFFLSGVLVSTKLLSYFYRRLDIYISISFCFFTSFLYCYPRYAFLRQDAPAFTCHTILMVTFRIILLGFFSSIKHFLTKDAPKITFTNSARLLSSGSLSHHSCVCYSSLAWEDQIPLGQSSMGRRYHQTTRHCRLVNSSRHGCQ